LRQEKDLVLHLDALAFFDLHTKVIRLRQEMAAVLLPDSDLRFPMDMTGPEKNKK